MEAESLVYPSFTESKGTICPCIFCWKLIRFRSNDEIRFFGQKIKYFIQIFKLPVVQFQTQLFDMPFCPECVDLLRSMISIYRKILGFEGKLAGHKNTLIQHLKKCTNLDPLAEETGKIKGIVELRRQLMEAMGLEPSEIEVETQVGADVLDFFTADEPASPLTAPFEDSYNFEADQTRGTDQEAIQVNTKPEVVVDAKFTLPENIFLKDCSVRVGKINQESLVNGSSNITSKPAKNNKRHVNRQQNRRKIKPHPPEKSKRMRENTIVRHSFRDPSDSVEAIGLETSELKVEKQMDESGLDFYTADESASPLTLPFEEPCNFDADELCRIEQEVMQVETKPNVMCVKIELEELHNFEAGETSGNYQGAMQADTEPNVVIGPQNIFLVAAAAADRKGDQEMRMGRHQHVDQFTCPICLKRFRTRTSKAHHVQSHNPQACTICGTVISSRSNMARHMRRLHLLGSVGGRKRIINQQPFSGSQII